MNERTGQGTNKTLILHQAQKRPREIRVPAEDVVRSLIAEVHQSLTTKQRLAMIRRLQHELLDHPSVDVTDWFIELGGLRVLVLQLGLVLDRHEATSTVHEIHGLCHCIDELLRKSNARDTIMETLFEQEENNASATIQLLERASRLWDAPQIPSIAHWISACASGTEHLLHASGLRRRMIQLLLSSGTAVSREVLGCFKNISYFDRQGRLLMTEPSFLTKLSELSLSETADAERLSAIWRNLALVHDCRLRLKQEVDILRILYALATITQSQTATEDSKTTINAHRNVLSTVITLSMDQDFCVYFLLFGDGLFTSLLQRFLASEDSTTRKRAARVLRLWATHASSANLLVQSSELMGCLSAAAVRDMNIEVRHEAAEAFGRCASWIQSPMPQHQAILRALTELCQTAPPAIVARAIKGQAALPNNRSILPENQVLVDALINIALQPEVSILTREDACAALLHLTSIPTNCTRLLSKRLLDALCLNLTGIPAAAEMVVHIAAEPNHRGVLLQHDQFLKSLIRCAAQPEHPLKQELKQIILQLVEEL